MNRLVSFTSLSQDILICGCEVKSMNLAACISGRPFVFIATPMMQQYVPGDQIKFPLPHQPILIFTCQKCGGE